jgi:flap endonuclease-1
MGILGLTKLISKYVPKAMTKKKFDDFSGKVIAIDASLVIYQIIIALRNSGRDLTNEKGAITSHIYGLFFKNIKFLELGITPIYVFDGKSPKIKSNTLNQRRQLRKEAQTMLNNTDLTREDKIKYFKRTYSITKSDVTEAQILLDLMGIPYIIAPSEADIVLAYLAMNGYVDGVCSDDSDILAFGAPYLFKDMSRFMNKNKEITVISLKRVLSGLKIDMSKFIDMCILLGCDYCDPIPKIGSARAYELVRRYSSLNEILEKLQNRNPNINIDIECMLQARDYYRDAHKEIKPNQIHVELKQCQENELIDFMIVKHGFDLIRIQNRVNKLKHYLRKMKITKPNTNIVHTIKPNMYSII